MSKELSDIAGADIIDPRDLVERKDELEAARDAGTVGECSECFEPTDTSEDFFLCADHEAEYDKLKAIIDELGPSDDISYLISDSHFEDYARELAKDIGAISGTEGWPQSYIDWEQAARELQHDYTSIEIEGTTYWGRA